MCLSEKDRQTYQGDCSEMFDNITPKAKNKKYGQKGGQQTGKEKVSSQARSKIYKMIHSPLLLSQKKSLFLKKNKKEVNTVTLFVHIRSFPMPS